MLSKAKAMVGHIRNKHVEMVKQKNKKQGALKHG